MFSDVLHGIRLEGRGESSGCRKRSTDPLLLDERGGTGAVRKRTDSERRKRLKRLAFQETDVVVYRPR